MDSMTITEALAEIKTIGKRLEKKRDAIRTYLVRDARLKDPLEKDGGSVEFVRRERQAIGDLETRLVAIRTAIQHVNLEATLTLGGKTMSVAEWLTWRREVADGAGQFLKQLASGIRGLRDKITREGRRVVAAGEDERSDSDVLVALNEKALSEEIEDHERILGELDGKLSLLNATTTVSV